GGGQNWSTTSNVPISLAAGSQTLRVQVVNSGFNFNWMNFALVNAFPSVSITAPSNNAVFVGLNPISVNANASDPDGTISKVEFYAGATLVGTDDTSPYSISWTPTAPGTYALTAK